MRSGAVTYVVLAACLTPALLVEARYYDPQTGRFLQEDELRFHGGPNFYVYAENNPVRWIDPLGLLPRKGRLRVPFTDIDVDFAETWPEVRNGVRGELDEKLPVDSAPIPGKTRAETLDQLADEFTDELRIGEGVALQDVKAKLDACPPDAVELRKELTKKGREIVDDVIKRVRRRQRTWSWEEWNPYFQQLGGN